MTAIEPPHLDTLSAEQLTAALASVFAAAGHEFFEVGGSIRDSLLGQTRTSRADLDFATSALPETSAEILEGFGCGKPYRVGEKFGTIGLVLARHTIEITTYRAEVYALGSRKPRVRFGTSLREDLLRRDFTVNAMARDPLSGVILDPTDGIRDLSAGVIRAVGNAEERFLEDPLRLLRAVRFAARLGFDIEAETWKAMRRTASMLKSISRERVQDEYTKVLLGERPSLALTLLRDSTLLSHSVPLLLELDRMPDHGPHHPLSLWEHTMRVVDAVPAVLPLRWAALLHDIAKPRTRTTEPSGRPRFFGHETQGAELAREVMQSLRYSSAVTDATALLIESHMQLHAYASDWSDGAVRRLLLRLGPLTDAAISLARADAAGHSGTGLSRNAPKFDQLDERVRSLDRPVETLRSPLSGEDLMARYGRPPGAWIGRIKDALLSEVIEGNLDPDDRTGAWDRADSLIANEGW